MRHPIAQLGFATFLFLVALSAYAYSDDYSVTVKGFIFGFDGSTGKIAPLKGARVILMDSDADGSTIFDDEMGSSHVAADGSFSVTGTGGDPGSFSWSKPDIYIRIVYNNDAGVRLTDELDRDRYVDTPEHDHDNFSGDLDIGTWIIGQDVGIGNASKCGVWMAACNAWDQYVTIVGQNPPSGKFDVEYWSGVWSGTPWTNDNTTHWPIHYTSYAMRHEFGHVIRHAFDGDRNHFNWDVTRFRYARNHDNCDPDCNRIPSDTKTMGLAFGFNEGWAEFWADDTRDCGSNTDEECEGNNAHALLVLSQTPGVGKKGMVAVLKGHAGQIHSLGEFENFFMSSKSMSLSAMKSILKSAKSDTAHAQRSSNLQPMAARLQVVRIQIQEAKAEIGNLERQMMTAEELAHGVRDCDSGDCYLQCVKLMHPIVLGAEHSLKSLELERMELYASPRYQEDFTQQLTNGKLESFLANQRRIYNQKIIQINVNAFNQAIGTFKNLRSHGNIPQLLRKDMELKLNKFKKITRTGKLPRFAGSQFIFKEDSAKLKRD